MPDSRDGVGIPLELAGFSSSSRESRVVWTMNIEGISCVISLSFAFTFIDNTGGGSTGRLESASDAKTLS